MATQNPNCNTVSMQHVSMQPSACKPSACQPTVSMLQLRGVSMLTPCLPVSMCKHTVSMCKHTVSIRSACVSIRSASVSIRSAYGKHTVSIRSAPHKTNQNAMEQYYCECGKLFNHRQSLFRHKKSCTTSQTKNTIVSEPANNNYPQIEYIVEQNGVQIEDIPINTHKRNDHQNNGNDDDEGDIDPPFNPTPPNSNFYYNQPSTKPPLFSSPNIKSNNNNYQNGSTSKLFNKSTVDLTGQYETCEHLQLQIEQLLLNNDVETAEIAGKLVLEDRKLYESYVNAKLSEVSSRKEEAYIRRKELERELGITPQQIENIERELNEIRSLSELNKLVKLKRFTFEYLYYEMKYNERFVKEIPALQIMKHNVENFKNLHIKKDIMNSQLDESKINELLKSSHKKATEKIIKHVILAVVGILLCILLLIMLFTLFSFTQILVLLLLLLLTLFVYFNKHSFL